MALRPKIALGYLESLLIALAQISHLARESFASLTKRILPLRTYVSLTFEQIVLLGQRSLPVVMLGGIAIGSIMALQLGYGLKRFGGNLYVPAIVGIAVLRELGPILICLLLAGRVGSGITAEIAAMTVTEQVEAIIALGSNPIAELVVPRVVACMIVFPILALVGDYLGILSAMWIGRMEFGIPFGFFLSKTLESIQLTDVFGGLVKSFVFGLMISVVACWKGLSPQGGTRGVGLSTTEVVVISSILVLIGDVFLTKLLIEVGWFGAIEAA